MYFGNPNLRYVKLNEDMLSYDTTIGKKGIESIDMNESGFGPKVTEKWKSIPSMLLWRGTMVL